MNPCTHFIQLNVATNAEAKEELVELRAENESLLQQQEEWQEANQAQVRQMKALEKNLEAAKKSSSAAEAKIKQYAFIT